MNLYESISTKLNESGVSGKLYLVVVSLYSYYYGLGKTVDEAYDNAISHLMSERKFTKKQLHRMYYTTEDITMEDLRNMEVVKGISDAFIRVVEFDSGKVVNSYWIKG